MCDCVLCMRSKNLSNFLEGVEDKVYAQKIYEQLCDVEEELSFQTMYLDNLKRLYPQIYREIHTIKKLYIEKNPQFNI